MLRKYFGPALLASLIQGSNGQALDANGVSLQEKVEAIELRLLEPGSIDFGVSPCSNLLLDDPDKGEQTAAQWVRIVFHDAITHNINTGLGGLDASIGFEKDREENKGEIFIDATIGDFAQHSSIYRSVSDVIGLGLAASMISCDPTRPLIKLRAGRKDATEAGPFGVPGHLDTVAFSQTAFANAGFNSTEMIQSIACGHSIGAVHRINFDDIVGPEVITAGSHGNATFDTTPFVFDQQNVIEYVTNTGNRGGPLVTSFNPLARSDLRIFESDNNATVQALAAASANQFRATCFRLFEKMLDTVPAGTTLSAPVVPRTWVLRKGLLDLDNANVVRYIGVVTYHHKTIAAPTQANIFFGTTGGGNTGPQTTLNGAPHAANPASALYVAYGPITDYSFNKTLNGNAITSFNIAATSGSTTSVFSRAINQNVFILPFKSHRRFTNVNGQGFWQYYVRAAVRTSIIGSNSISVTLFYPTTQEGSKAGRFIQYNYPLIETSTRGDFKIYEAVFTHDLPAGTGEHHLEVKVGTTIKSNKVSGGNFNFCTIDPITSC